MVACTLLSFFAVGCEKDKAKPDATVQTNVQQIYVHNPGEDVDDAIHANVDNVVKSIKENKIVEHVGAKVVGAYYNIESGEVSW
jgi:carbonic anhydrase